jgi:hypothetical protein
VISRNPLSSCVYDPHRLGERRPLRTGPMPRCHQ